MPFAPGQSGNPGGRPKGSARIRELIAERGEELVNGLFEIAMDTEADPKARIMATKELLDRGYGKATQPVDGDGEGGPIKLSVSWQAPE